MYPQSKIVIIGGGIGGLTVAIALRRKDFKNITIYERRSVAQSLGAGFVIWPNASWVLDKLGFLEEVAKFGGRLEQMQRWTEQGGYLGGIDVKQIEQGIGYPSYAVSQAEFQDFLLVKAIDEGVTLQKNQFVSAIEDHNLEKSILRFEDDSTVEADVVIGADGRMNSITKKYIQGDNKPIYQNYINWVGALESAAPLSIENNILDYWGCGARFGIVPINDHQLYWAGCKALPVDSVNIAETDKIELLKLFKDWPGLISTVIGETRDQDIKRIPVFDHDPNPNWYKNKVCLLGDAAHASLPTSGQGACQAIEDSWHFAEMMSVHQTLPQVFNAYLNTRFEKTKVITQTAREFATSLFNTDQAFCSERNNLAKATDYEKMVQGMIRLWSKNLI